MLIELLASNPTLLVFLCLIFGLLFGSFFNVVVYRFPMMLFKDWHNQCQDFLSEIKDKPHLISEEQPFNIAIPRSKCVNCKNTIQAIDNIPILSYLWLRGQCRHCKTPISIRYPLVEASTAILSIIVLLHFGINLLGLSALLLTWGLLIVSLIDYDHQIIPDQITLPGIWLGIFFNVYGFYCPLQEAVLGAILGYLTLWSVYWAFKLLTKKEGMGYGDFKLLSLLGAWLGWKALMPIVLISSLSGAIIGIALILINRIESKEPIPFGPYLALAGWITLLWGDRIATQYLGLIGLTN